ncbi:MAG: cation-translocating P-type ATPase [Chlorobiaceae bacterium]|nr:cation-translocating P-type ATPase [Chlorobiaceae bacterium]
MIPQPWHSLPPEQILTLLDTGPDGLAQDEAERRLAAYGPNLVIGASASGPWKIFFAQFRNVLILMLLAATVLSAILGHEVEAAAISVIVLLAVLLGFVQEYRAEKAIEALKDMAAPNARVLRGGGEQLLPVSLIVPGDLLLIAAGDRVAADGRLIESSNLRMDEASLTGESLPSEKSAVEMLAATTGVADRVNMLFAGTAATYGRGRLVVTATGMETEFGRIAGLLQTVDTGKTPLQKNLDRVGTMLARVALAIVLVIVAFGIMRGQPLIDILVFGIALAVAVVPEALPAVVTISLALGVRRMAGRHALMRRLPAVETLGSTTVVCTDKTGTLTRDEMTVRTLYADGMTARVSGSGYCPEGLIERPDTGNALQEPFRRLLEAGVLCNDARLFQEPDGRCTMAGDPTEAALIVAARKAGIDEAMLGARYPRISEQPFDSATKRMATLHRDGGAVIAIVKGAPEVILPACTSFASAEGEVPFDSNAFRSTMSQVDAMGSEALRVLAIACKTGTVEPDIDAGLTFLGLAGMIDPPREEARPAVARCRDAGIRPVMITGDHPQTATAIARELGILRDGRVLTGSDLDRLDENALRNLAGSVEVFARVSPEHKLRIVEALQAAGEVVAMTGDGVNDAPALKKADIGISMGIAGTDVAREASAMTLLDDNFSSIVAAIEEGRGIYDNIAKYLTYLLSSNIGELGLMAGATVLGMPLPLSAVQILYVNLATDGLPALALAVDPAEAGIMKRRPNNPGQGIFTSKLLALMLAGGFWSTIVNLALFEWARSSGRSLGEAMTMTFVSLVLIQFFKAYNFRSLTVSVSNKPFGNRWLNMAILWELCMLAAIVTVPALRGFSGTFPIPAVDWLIVFCCSMTVIPVIEGVKWMARKGIIGPKA